MAGKEHQSRTGRRATPAETNIRYNNTIGKATQSFGNYAHAEAAITAADNVAADTPAADVAADTAADTVAAISAAAAITAAAAISAAAASAISAAAAAAAISAAAASAISAAAAAISFPPGAPWCAQRGAALAAGCASFVHRWACFASGRGPSVPRWQPVINAGVSRRGGGPRMRP
eukprot:GHVT01080338.1.p2 GENE.GHVT01080338.1~~GHVT01080338.1.p2  ORF type:complete len:176 (-),score=62.02 GHVT01080338.1:3329-3856(-)